MSATISAVSTLRERLAAQRAERRERRELDALFASDLGPAARQELTAIVVRHNAARVESTVPERPAAPRRGLRHIRHVRLHRNFSV